MFSTVNTKNNTITTPARVLRALAAVVLTLLISACMKQEASKLQDVTPQTLPTNERGFEHGTSGSFGGVLGSTILYGAGCNFPDQSPHKGGKKKYYAGIYALDKGQLELVTHLPTPRGYGASLIDADRKALLLVGGMDDDRLYPEIFSAKLYEGKPTLERWEHSLPFGWAEGGAGLDEHRLYLAGGWCEKGTPLLDVVCLDLATGASERMATLPDGARIQPGVFVHDGGLFLFGGNNPGDGSGPARIQETAYRLDLTTHEWTALQSPLLEGERLPFIGTAVTYDPVAKRAYAAGGVNFEIFTNAVTREYRQSLATTEAEQAHFAELRHEYMEQEPEWYRFSPALMTYDPAMDRWSALCRDTAFATAGAVLTTDGAQVYCLGGERKPGVRTPHFWSYSLQ